MSALIKSKKISKWLIGLGCFTVLFSVAFFGYSSLSINADDPTPIPEGLKTNLFINESGGTAIIQMSEVDSAITQETSDIIKIEDANRCETETAPCYQLQSGGSWDQPSILQPNRPAWAFLTEAKQRAQSGQARLGESVEPDRDAETIVRSIISAYVQSSFDAWNVVQWDTDQIVVTSESLVSTAVENEVPVVDIADEITIYWPTSMVTLHLSENYPNAKEGSMWLATADFLLGSVIQQWEEAANANDVQINKLTLQKQRLLNYIAKYEYSLQLLEQSEESGNIIQMGYPATIDLLQPAIASPFTISIDKTKYPLPTGQSDYKLKVFLKPTGKQGEQYHKWYEPGFHLDGEVYKTEFTWDTFKAIPYVGSDGTTVIPESITSQSDYYNVDFPQSYNLKIILYEGTTSTSKEELSGSFQTVDSTWISAGPVTGSSSLLSITATPSGAGQGTKITTTITVTKSTNPEIKAVVLYACNGAIPNDDSSNCTLKGPEGEQLDAIKGQWTSFTYNPDNKATLTGEWNTSGSAIGSHSLMAKAFTSDGTYGVADQNYDYITPNNFEGPRSKTSVTINITNSTITQPSEHRIDTRYGGLLAGLFGSKATDNPRGSSITSIDDILDKVIKYGSGLIGVVAFFVLLIAGIMHITAGGNAEQAAKAKKAIGYALLGIAIFFLSYAIMYNVVVIIKNITGAGSGSGTGLTSLKDIIGENQTEFSLKTAFEAVQKFIRILTSLAAIVGFVMIIWASFLYVTSVGDENKAETAKKTLIWSIAGTFIVSLAGYIVDLVDRFLA